MGAKPTIEQINELKHRALLLQIHADERARLLTEDRVNVPPGYLVRDVYTDTIAKFAAAVVAILEPLGSDSPTEATEAK